MMKFIIGFCIVAFGLFIAYLIGNILTKNDYKKWLDSEMKNLRK
ncbi:hypothetical protein LCGC14_2932110 [marine sediment metagenome]|uniref:Uncharacterized protein n=1 Tax=marine sediment metagenome TaxID=412755 RepID=A0A0F8XL15_9ZZZZ